MYRSRFRLWDLWKHDRGRNAVGSVEHRSQPDIYDVALYNIPKSDQGDCSEIQNVEMLYRAVRDYYHGAFSAERWAFHNTTSGTTTSENLLSHQLAVERTDRSFRAGEETWLRFWAALNLLERPSRGGNGGKEGDFAESVRLMRVAFAALSHILFDHEPPLLFLYVVHIVVLFRESPVRGFDSIETQLLRHLHGLTSTANGGLRHPTALLWRILWSGSGSISRHRSLLRTCTAIAIDIFTQYIGYFHPWTVELSEFSIDIMYAGGTGDPDEKTVRLRTLLQQLENLNVYDSRHINIVCCLSNHYRQYANNEGGQTMLGEAITLLEGVLNDPGKANAVTDHPSAGFNLFSQLNSIYDRLGRWDLAERYIRSGIALAEPKGLSTGGEVDLLEGLSRLEEALRMQGKIIEANTVQEKRKRLIKTSLEMVGEREDSA